MSYNRWVFSTQCFHFRTKLFRTIVTVSAEGRAKGWCNIERSSSEAHRVHQQEKTEQKIETAISRVDVLDKNLELGVLLQMNLTTTVLIFKQRFDPL